jgi:hypothetical protein
MARTKSIKFPNSEGELSNLFDKLQRSTVNSLLVSGALAIHGSSSPTVKTAATFYAMVDGVLMSKAAADLVALVGTVTAAKFNVFVFTTDVSGNIKAYMGTEGAALVNVVCPTTLDGECPIGLVIINPTGTGNFVGGTTNLDDGTVVPNAVYINLIGEFFPQFATL